MGKRLYGTCELCKRDDLELTVHHLTPKELGGTFEPTADLCIACHKQIHALYTNEELAARLHTIEALQADEKISSFLKWIRKQPSSKLVKTKKSNERKQKGR
ncbi:HNH endonuclease [Ectobacillus sp. JY-23]|uniref:HNH endonuclease n=1 Tax=Ectobacillus sp. JY-23 TaxID=2933872 RepID=UPI001FF5C6F4|nr:HNH endonuclease [Ectobacillus sp. JY-23]UOY92085.1 HNH endonuclease [Ectobacillus sp. JY-23]